MSVVDDFSKLYRQHSEQALAVPVVAIDLQKDGVIQDDDDRSMSLKAVTRVADHFKQQDFKGAKRSFIVVATENDGMEGSEVYFYDPKSQAMIRDPKAPEWSLSTSPALRT